MRGAFISSFPLSNRRAASPGADHATHRDGCSGNSMRLGRCFFKNGPQTSTRHQPRQQIKEPGVPLSAALHKFSSLEVTRAAGGTIP
jgi:hypothetical protein